MKKETKKDEAPRKHKQAWQEKYATPEQIKAMLADRVMLRYNEVRGRTEIHWLSQGLLQPRVRLHRRGTQGDGCQRQATHRTGQDALCHLRVRQLRYQRW